MGTKVKRPKSLAEVFRTEAGALVGGYIPPATERIDGSYDQVDHPQHYGGADNPYEAIKVIEAWGLGFCLGNAVKYLARAGRKPGAAAGADLRKAIWYIQREIERTEGEAAHD